MITDIKEIEKTIGKKYDVIVRRGSYCCYYFKFRNLNKKGEVITIELSLSTSDGGKKSLPYLWKKFGYINHILTNWWSLTVFANNPKDGITHSKYNPQVTYANTPVLNFDWVLEATEENAIKIMDEIVIRAFA